MRLRIVRAIAAVCALSLCLFPVPNASAVLLGPNSPHTALILPPLQLFTTFAWEASYDENVAGYAVYQNIAGLGITNRMDVGNNLSITMPLLVGSLYNFYVVAYDEDGNESDASNMVQYTPPLVTPLRLTVQEDRSVRLNFRTTPLALTRVEWTDNLETPNWQPLGLGVTVADLTGAVVITDSDASEVPMRFYRARKL